VHTVHQGPCRKSVTVDLASVSNRRKQIVRGLRRLRIWGWLGTRDCLTATPTRLAVGLRVLRLAVWADLPVEADAAGWFAQPADDHRSEHRVQRRDCQQYRREHATSFRAPDYYGCQPEVCDVHHKSALKQGKYRAGEITGLSCGDCRGGALWTLRSGLLARCGRGTRVLASPWHFGRTRCRRACGYDPIGEPPILPIPSKN